NFGWIYQSKQETIYLDILQVLQKEVDHGLPISLKLILPGSMPEWLMGTNCKFVGNMSTLVGSDRAIKIRRWAWK
ncbi:hypothetical protein HAX54_026583, partial [Datura stramonium]|nr:hypothetical protein [Datura stramonium]